jgi:hypothetical protein
MRRRPAAMDINMGYSNGEFQGSEALLVTLACENSHFYFI